MKTIPVQLGAPLTPRFHHNGCTSPVVLTMLSGVVANCYQTRPNNIEYKDHYYINNSGL